MDLRRSLGSCLPSLLVLSILVFYHPCRVSYFGLPSSCTCTPASFPRFLALLSTIGSAAKRHSPRPMLKLNRMTPLKYQRFSYHAKTNGTEKLLLVAFSLQ